MKYLSLCWQVTTAIEHHLNMNEIEVFHSVQFQSSENVSNIDNLFVSFQTEYELQLLCLL